MVPSPTFDSLPVDIHVEIAKRLPDFASLESFSQTCKSCYEAVSSAQGSLTRPFLREEFNDDDILCHAAWTFKLKPAFAAADFDIVNNKRICATKLYAKRRHARHPLRTVPLSQKAIVELLNNGYPPVLDEISLSVSQAKGLIRFHKSVVMPICNEVLPTVLYGERVLCRNYMPLKELQTPASNVERKQFLRACYRLEMVTRILRGFYKQSMAIEQAMACSNLCKTITAHFTSWEMLQATELAKELNSRICRKIPAQFAKTLRIKRYLWPKVDKFCPYVQRVATSFGLEWYVRNVLGDKTELDGDVVRSIFHLPERHNHHGSTANLFHTSIYNLVLTKRECKCNCSTPFLQRGPSVVEDGCSSLIMAGIANSLKVDIDGIDKNVKPEYQAFLSATAIKERIFWDIFRLHTLFMMYQVVDIVNNIEHGEEDPHHHEGEEGIADDEDDEDSQ